MEHNLKREITKNNGNSNLKKLISAVGKNRFFRFMDEKGIFCFLLSFIIPVAVMIYVFAQNGIHPFGDRQILVVDSWHQYFPFFRVEREKLMDGGSFLYSWQNGMGTNFLSLISYYASSPLNWLSVFFSDENARDAFTFILIAKIGFSGAFFSCFLRYTYKRKDISICIFSAMFALCSYVLGYYWNVMWFDTVALFPLVMTGVVAICRERKWKLFTFSLALSLISSYYVGYFTCIFCIFMFAAAGIIEPKGIKDFFIKLYIMVRSSLLGIALSAFITLPAYFGLQLTYSANNVFPQDTTFYEKWTDLFANLLSFSQPAKVEGLPNFACGMLAVFLFGVFVFSLGIKIREKISVLVMLSVIVVSCNMNKLNYIWHGFHFTNQIPYRFAFIFSFVLVAAAFRAYDVMMKKGITVYQIVLSLIAPSVIFYLNYRKNPDDFSFVGANKTVFIIAVAITLALAVCSSVFSKKSRNNIIFIPVLAVVWGTFFMFYTDSDDHIKFEDFFNKEKTDALQASLIVTSLFLLVFVLVKIINIKNQSVRSHVTSIGLACVLGFELVGNACIGVQTVDTSSYTSYPDKNEQVQSLLSYADENDDSLFYRTEMTGSYTLNDSSLYGYYGISQFSSAANVSVTKFMKRMGIYASEAGNRYYYRISTPVFNSIFGLKYIISKKGALQSEEMSLSTEKETDNVYLYKNNYPLSLGFMMNDDILNISGKPSANPFEYQNTIIKLATGVEGCFTAQPVALVDYKNMEVKKSGFGNYSFTRENQNLVSSSVYSYDGVENAYLYGYATNGGCDKLNVKCDNVTVDSDVSVEDYPIVFPMGNGQKGSTSTVEIFAKSDSSSGSYRLMVYALKKDIFEEAYNNLADEQLEITSFSDTEITGNINVLNDGMMFLSIPYEKGWTVYVDGEEAETTEVLSAMLGVKLGAGQHSIKLKYTPEGLVAGIAVSCTAMLLCGAVVFFDIKRRKKKRSQQDLSESETDNEEISEDIQININETEAENAESESDDSLQGD
ncbi:MAG: YfhO family protein [Ruminococcus sp.]|nr:YfhO family protein [Ruminococcus sp.]